MNAKTYVFISLALPAIAMAGGDHTDRTDVAGGKFLEHHEHAAASMGDNDHDLHDNEAGQPGALEQVTRTIKVSMDDRMRFTPDQLNFSTGETVRFLVRNDGKIRHEMVIGSQSELKEHAAMMRTNPAMRHTDPNMISLAPGERSELIWKFDQPGTFEFACLVPGHLEAGMSGKVNVQ